MCERMELSQSVHKVQFVNILAVFEYHLLMDHGSWCFRSGSSLVSPSRLPPASSGLASCGWERLPGLCDDWAQICQEHRLYVEVMSCSINPFSAWNGGRQRPPAAQLRLLYWIYFTNLIVFWWLTEEKVSRWNDYENNQQLWTKLFGLTEKQQSPFSFTYLLMYYSKRKNGRKKNVGKKTSIMIENGKRKCVKCKKVSVCIILHPSVFCGTDRRSVGFLWTSSSCAHCGWFPCPPARRLFQELRLSSWRSSVQAAQLQHGWLSNPPCPTVRGLWWGQIFGQ